MTLGKESVRERPLQDKPCSIPRTCSGGRLLLPRAPSKATTCNCAQRPQGREKLQSKPNTDLEVITAYKNEDEDEDEDEEDEDEANWLG